MKSHVVAAALLSAPLLLAGAAHAQSLKQKELIVADTAKVGELAKEANQACGSQIAFRVDYPSYEHVSEDVNNQNPWAYLANATDALKHVCRTDEGKKAVQAKIKTVTVSNGDAEAESLTNGDFHYVVPYRGHSPATVIKWFETNL